MDLSSKINEINAPVLACEYLANSKVLTKILQLYLSSYNFK